MIVATLEPLGAGVMGLAVSESVLVATIRRIVPPVENKVSNLKYVHVYYESTFLFLFLSWRLPVAALLLGGCLVHVAFPLLNNYDKK